MSRIRKRCRDELDEPGQAFWDRVVEQNGQHVIDDDGGLRGPLDAFVARCLSPVSTPPSRRP